MPISYNDFSIGVAPPPATAEAALYDRQLQGMRPVTARSDLDIRIALSALAFPLLPYACPRVFPCSVVKDTYYEHG